MKKGSITSIPEENNIKKRHGAAIIAASLATLWLLFELAVFFVSVPNAPELKIEGDGGYVITEANVIELGDASVAIETLSFDVKLVDGEKLYELPKVTVTGFDTAASRVITYKSKKFCVGDGDAIRAVIRLDIPEGASDIKLSFNYEGYDYTVSDIKVNSKDDVSFNFARCAIVFAVILLFWACAHFKLWQILFDGEKHGIAALAICIFCVIMTLMLTQALNPDRKPLAYPLSEEHMGSYNQYIQQFDALMKGQLNIDYEPSEELLVLENPYDYAQRQGVSYLWDRAFYNGQYFSYFGMAPLFTVYFPYHAITGNIPADDTVSAIFALMTGLFFSMAAVKWAATFTKKLPLPLLIAGTVSALLSTQVFLIARGYSRVYYIATVAGMAFLSAFIWLFLCGLSGSVRLRKKNGEPPAWFRPLMYALAGLAFGLCFLSRFNIALTAAFVIIPVLWFFVATQKDGEGKRRLRPLKRLIPELVFLALPVIAAVGYQLWLNVTRFDSLFEFGTSYQLTVSDVSQNKLRLTDLPAAIFHYFLQPLLPSIDPPIISLFYVTLNNYGHYVYIDTGMGLLSIPIMLGLLGSAFVFTGKRYGAASRWTAASLLTGLVAVALFDFCLGGVIFRYTCDLTLIASFASMAFIFAAYEDITVRDSNGVRTAAGSAVMALLVLSAFVSLSLAFSDNANLTAYKPEICELFRSLLGA